MATPSGQPARLFPAWCCLGLLLLLLAGSAWPAAAQPAVAPDTVFTVGTTIKDSQGRRWAYLLWQATEQDLIIGKSFALYAKPGSADSASPYQLKAITQLQTEPLVIQALLNRAAQLGDDLTQLEDRLHHLFVGLLPPAAPSLAQKLSAVILGSLGHPDHFANLALLGRLHPGVNFCIGYAHAELVPPGLTTFEIREYDKTTGRELGVLGRVTVDGDIPVVLPAPGRPVQVPETDDLGNPNPASAKGDLNVKLRWATPPDLRRWSLLNYGFNVYRLPRAAAEAQGYHTTPPSPAALAAHPASVLVNRLPVLQTRAFDLASVADFLADATTVFLADDNGRYRDGGQPFVNGDQYYYFVTARDVLGRDGLVSPGTLITLCDRLPPDPPRGLQVLNDYSYTGGAAKQVLKVRWLQHTNTSQDTVTAYYVYRWASPSQVQTLGGNPLAHRIAGPLPHLPGQKFREYLDDALGSPQAPADYGKTIWYTVRAADDGACDGGNLSPHSAPAFGVLRDRTGPDAPTGGITVLCCFPSVSGNPSFDIPDPERQDPTLAYYRLLCRRKRPDIQWVEFYLFTPADTNAITRAYFPAGSDEVALDWTIARNLVDQGFIPFFSRTGTAAGEVSEFAQVQTTRAPKETTLRVVPFDTTVECQRLSQREAAAQKTRCHGGAHQPHPDGTPEVEGPVIIIQLKPGTKEYRLYRRVDYGPLTLLKQGPADFDSVSQIEIPDNDMPANAAIVCYYAQLFDEHGNPSPLEQLGDCLALILPTAIPMLAPLEAQGDLGSPKMRVRWFCPPYGIERFEVAIANQIGIVAPSLSSDLSPQIPTSPQVRLFTHNGVTQTNTFALFHTPLVGPAFGNGALFEVTVDVALGVQYTVMISAIGKSGALNPPSNVEQFLWTPPPPAVGPDVPWPARPLPNVNVFSPGLEAVRLPDPIYPGLAIRIGAYPRKYLETRTEKPYPGILKTHVDPLALLYTNKLGQILFPAVAYRTQLANEKFPKVSGDLVQVTPLMESIAYELLQNPSLGEHTVVHDPFIRIVPAPVGNNAGTGAIYLLDTQPALAGAAYVYLLVRLAPNGEILEVVPTNPVLVTP